MILQKEVAIHAEAQQIPKSTIDKDWALGHFLAAIYSDQTLRDTLVFKGGTCLRKCWLPEYRFSEDLDFTSRSSSFQFIRKHLESICIQVNANAGLLTHITSLKPLKFNNELTGFAAIVKFWGSDHSKSENPPSPDRWLTSVKIEIILYEILVFPSVLRTIHHGYSDQIVINPNLISCYSIEEILSEKIRALIQRSYSAPRELFDIWYLSRNCQDINYSAVINAFHKKMIFKGLSFTGIDQLINPSKDRSLRAAWKNSLAHQLPPSLFVDYDIVRNDILLLLNKMFS